MAFARLDINTVTRQIAVGSSFDASIFNDTFREITNDFAELSDQWNNQLLAVFSSIPDGTADSDVNAYINGLDGRTIWVFEQANTVGDNATYYNSNKQRPNTIKEQFDDLYTILENLNIGISQIANEQTSTGDGLTEAQKIAIGINIFDSTQTSASSSLDGLTQAHSLYLGALATFVGQDSSSDSSPQYSSNNQILDGDSLQTAIGKLDAAVGIPNTGILASERVHSTGEQVITTATASLTDSAYVVLVNIAAGSLITLPNSPAAGQIIKVKDIYGNAGSYNIVISGAAATIDGANATYLTSDYESKELLFSNTQNKWYIL